jgi:hypothetical protein
MLRKNQIRDADKIVDPQLVGQWQSWEIVNMDERFAEAMQRAGYPATSPSTVPETRCPKRGYERPD